MSPVELTKDLERKSRVFALVGDPTRIRILRLLSKKGKLKVSDIAAEVDHTVACISHHLQLLKDNGILRSQRSGNSIYYNITTDTLVESVLKLI